MNDVTCSKANISLNEEIMNDSINSSLINNSDKLLNSSNALVGKFKNLNDELKEIIQTEKELKSKEIITERKRNDLIMLERKLKEKNGK